MQRRDFFKAAGVFIGAPMLNFGRCYAFGGQLPVRAVDLVGRSLVIDMLGLLTTDWPGLARWHEEPKTFTKDDFRILTESGVNVFHPAVDLNTTEPYSETTAWLSGWRRFLQANSSYFLPVQRATDLLRAQSSGKAGVLLGMQNSSHFRRVDDVAEFYRLGQRLSQLTYNAANRLGSGCMVRHDRGLTSFGAEVIGAMNACGMAVDVSHAGERTTLDAFEASTKPVLITHANCKNLSSHPRCKSDEVIRQMAKSGGVFGVTCVSAFLRDGGSATLDDALNHIEHVVRVAGVEHVGLGTDLDVQARGRQKVAGLNQPMHIFTLTAGLLRRGFSTTHIEAILGGNFQRALSSTLS